MNYLSTNEQPQGEVFLKGDCVTHGYYKNEKATAESIFEGGWLATGDIGQWNDKSDHGSLAIIDRKKNLFKLAQGEYVSPETLEQEYAKAGLVSQIWVYGNSLQATLLAVVVPDIPASLAWAKSHHGKPGATIEEIVKMEEFKKAVLEQLSKLQVSNKFKKYEAIVDCVFETNVNELGQGFHVENDLLTPSFKYKRPQLKAKYQAELEKLYAK